MRDPFRLYDHPVLSHTFEMAAGELQAVFGTYRSLHRAAQRTCVHYYRQRSTVH